MKIYSLAKRALFRLEPERAHDVVIGGLSLLSRSMIAPRLMASFALPADPRLEVDAFGLRFPNPLGLAAGLDKDGVAFPALAALGFGAVEVGSVTALAQPGNPKPRIFRLVEDEALINRMGFNNSGAEALAGHLARIDRGSAPRAVLGVNVGKSKAAELARAAEDYRAALSAVWDVADYVTVNVSSPNTPGLRSLQRPESLREILGVVGELRRTRGPKAVLIKLAPDLDPQELAEVVQEAAAGGASGLVVSNTTISRPPLSSANAGESGGLSGRPLARRALEVLEATRGLTDLPLVAVGGIATPQDALERYCAGADLLQIYTSFIYQGPEVIRQILRGLSRALDEQALTSIGQLKGRALR